MHRGLWAMFPLVGLHQARACVRATAPQGRALVGAECAGLADPICQGLVCPLIELHGQLQFVELILKKKKVISFELHSFVLD